MRNLVKRGKMHEFFRLYRPSKNKGAHWHTPAVPHHELFVRYQYYRQAEAVFEQCRYAFYPELMPTKFQLLTDPVIDTDTVGQLADWGGAWAGKILADGPINRAYIEIDERYPAPTIVEGDWAIVPCEGGEFVLAEFVALPGIVPGYILEAQHPGINLGGCLAINRGVSQPFFIYNRPPW